METKFIKLSGIVFLSIALSACVMTPVRPVGYGYRTTSSTVMPTYVNGQYIGEQPGDTVVQTTTPVYTTPVYTTSVYTTPVYTTPVYTAPVYTSNYYPYYAPAYVDPWYPVGVGLGVGIGVNYFRGGWHRGHGIHRGHGGWHRGHRGWHR